MIGLLEVLTKNQKKALLHVSQCQRFANLGLHKVLLVLGQGSSAQHEPSSDFLRKINLQSLNIA